MANDPTTPAKLPRATYAPRPPRLPRPPFWMIAVPLVTIVASWVPLVLFARARVVPNDQPRVHFIQDMGTQPKYREQQSNDQFADGRADRLPVPGTVARGHLEEDDQYYRGYVRTGGTIDKPVVKFFSDFPSQVKISDTLIHRGQQRFNIFCAVCHGLDGHGHGAVNERALELMNQGSGTTWTPAADLTASNVVDRPVGHIYNTINVGIKNMPSYGSIIAVEDRWAIVAYVRALQANQAALTPTAPAPPAAGK